MSGAALGWAKAQRAPSVTAKAVLVALADYADQDGCAWPSIPRLAREVQVSERTVQRAIRSLEEAGLLRRDEQKRKDGGQTSNEYQLALPPCQIDIPPVSDCQGEGDTSVIPPVTLVSPPYEPPLEPKASDEASSAGKRTKSYPPAFELIWKAYPHSPGRSSKPKSLAEWQRLTATVRTELPHAIARYSVEGREPRADCGAPAMERWLRDERFVDWLPQPPASPEAVDEAVLRDRLQHFSDTGEWRPAWGPPPANAALIGRAA